MGAVLIAIFRVASLFDEHSHRREPSRFPLHATFLVMRLVGNVARISSSIETPSFADAAMQRLYKSHTASNGIFFAHSIRLDLRSHLLALFNCNLTLLRLNAHGGISNYGVCSCIISHITIFAVSCCRTLRIRVDHNAIQIPVDIHGELTRES
jgi:hypothetical protein